MNLFFNPPKREPTVSNLLCIPFLWARRRSCLGQSRPGPLGSELFSLDRALLLTGFLGAPHLLALLPFLLGPESRVWFLGTAGSLDPEQEGPALWTVGRTCLSGTERYPEWLHAGASAYPGVPGSRNLVSVTTLQEENRLWYQRMVQWGGDGVDMETAFLNRYLGGYLQARVVVSDQITSEGIRVFERRKVVRILEEGWSLCLQEIKEQS